MKVTLGPFAQSGIEYQLGADLTEAVETAIDHYTGKLRSGRRPTPPPQVFGSGVSTDFGTGTSTPAGTELDLTLDSETEAMLRREAMRYGTDVEAIAAHSVMVYLAELDFLSNRSRPV